MRMKLPLIGLGVAALFQFGLATEARASVTRCDNCDWLGYRTAAETYASGYVDVYVYVIDFAQAKLTLWNVHYDREQQWTFANEEPVPDSTEAMFLHVLNDKMQGKATIELVVRPGQNLGPPFSYNPTNGMGGLVPTM